MKYLCLAYGDEKDWKLLSKDEQDKLLAQDDVFRKRGDLVAAVSPATTVQAPKGKVVTRGGPFSTGKMPLARLLNWSRKPLLQLRVERLKYGQHRIKSPDDL